MESLLKTLCAKRANPDILLKSALRAEKKNQKPWFFSAKRSFSPAAVTIKIWTAQKLSPILYKIPFPMKPIAVIPKSTTHFFWRAVEGGAREGAKEAGAEMIWKGSLKEDDPAQQIQIFEQFVAEDVGGIVLAPIDDAALKRPVAAAMQKGIPVVIMDSAFEGEPL